MKPGVIVSTPDLRPSLMSILSGLRESGLLNHVVTTLAIAPKSLERMSRWPVLGSRISGLLSKRSYPDDLKDQISTYRFREICRATMARAGLRQLTHRVWHWAELGFDQHVAKHHAGQSEWIYGMEHSSLATFKRHKDLGGRTILRMVNAHGEYLAQVLEHEAERFPQWTNGYYRQLISDLQDTLDRKNGEYELVDRVVANSSFVRKTLIDQGLDSSMIHSIPTGCPAVSGNAQTRTSKGRAIRFLFVGSVSLRKGIPYLLDAWKALKPGSNAVLTIAGSNEMNLGSDVFIAHGVDYRGVLDSGSLSELMHHSDVFVLPTLAEGLAHSALEALSVGLPVISTEESGLGEFLRTGHNGWKVPARDVAALSSALQAAIDDPDRLIEMGLASQQIAAEWTVCDSNLAHLERISDILNETESHG